MSGMRSLLGMFARGVHRNGKPKTLSPKRAPRLYKGNQVGAFGRHLRKGGYKVHEKYASAEEFYKVPDLASSELAPYVSYKVPLATTRTKHRPGTLVFSDPSSTSAEAVASETSTGTATSKSE